MSNDGRIVVVTGGAQNIGRAITDKFLSEGDLVVVADITAPDVLPASDQLAFFHTDVASEASVATLMAHIAERYGRIDVLVNNAGICIEAPITAMTEVQWDRVMNVNVKSVFLMSRQAFPLLAVVGLSGSAIINISSIEGRGANPLHSAYAASKAAVAAFTHNTALEFGPHNIRCNAIAPGWINTPFNEALLAQYPDRAKVDAEIKALHPVGRLGLGVDIANTAFWLASADASFVTGQEIVVDGGRLAKLPLPNMGSS